jgi:hypothetical protein
VFGLRRLTRGARGADHGQAVLGLRREAAVDLGRARQ